MRLLILTQAIDREDPYLSFFHSWAAEFARQFDTVKIVCLKEGSHSLPRNVSVFSLGKEMGKGRFTYVARFFRYIVSLRKEYDVVLVHQNQEYVLLGAWLWKLLGKRVYLWRNHYAGNFLTDIASRLSTKVFCTSAYSYTARFKKTVMMPVGIDTDMFAPQAGISRIPRSVLFYGRMAPSKNPHILLDALELLAMRGVEFNAEIRGTPLPKDEAYAKKLHESAMHKGLNHVRFEPGLPHSEGPRVFSAAEIYVNLGDTGMYDKTIFEAAACGALVLAASQDYAKLVNPRFAFRSGDVQDLALKMETLLTLNAAERTMESEKLRRLVIEKHSLAALADALAKAMV